MKRIRFTKEGYENLKQEYDELLEKRPSAVDDLKKARELGDLSENGYYRAARAKLSWVDARLRRLTGILNSAMVVMDFGSSVIGIGHTITVSDGKKELLYHIVGDLEANPKEDKISLLSPIGRALAGKHVGDEVTIVIPAGTITYRIIKIS